LTYRAKNAQEGGRTNQIRNKKGIESVADLNSKNKSRGTDLKAKRRGKFLPMRDFQRRGNGMKDSREGKGERNSHEKGSPVELPSQPLNGAR